MLEWFSLVVSILALVVATTFLVRGELHWRRQKKAIKAAERHQLAGRSIPGVDEWVVFSTEDQEDLATPHVTTLKAAMDPDEFDPDDLTKGGGEFTFRDHPVDLGRERSGHAVPKRTEEP